jgi:type VI protein secretion system component VasK
MPCTTPASAIAHGPREVRLWAHEDAAQGNLSAGGAVSLLWATIAVALLIVWVISIVDIVRRHLGAKQTAAWILIVVILPVVGSVVYWAMRRPSAEEIQQQTDAQRELRSEAERRPFDSRRF